MHTEREADLNAREEQARSGRDLAEIWPRCARDAREMRARCARHLTRIRCSLPQVGMMQQEVVKLKAKLETVRTCLIRQVRIFAQS